MVMWWVEYFLTEDLQLFSFSIKAGWMDEPPQPKHMMHSRNPPSRWSETIKIPAHGAQRPELGKENPRAGC